MASALRLLCLAAVSAWVVALTAAPVASAEKHACSRPAVVEGAKARLVVKERSLFGCLRGSRRAVRVTSDDYDSEGGSWEKPRLAGTFAAVEVGFTDKCTEIDVQVVNLRTGVSRLHPAGSSSYASDVHPCVGHGSPTTDMALRSDGAIAFITGDEVVRGTRNGKIVTLEQGPQIDPTSLGLTRSGLVTWWSDGEPRSAALPWRSRR